SMIGRYLLSPSFGLRSVVAYRFVLAFDGLRRRTLLHRGAPSRKEQVRIFSQIPAYQRMGVKKRLQTGMLGEVPRFLEQQRISVQLNADGRIETQKLPEVRGLVLAEVFVLLASRAGSASAFAPDEVRWAPCDFLFCLRMVSEIHKHFWV